MSSSSSQSSRNRTAQAFHLLNISVGATALRPKPGLADTLFLSDVFSFCGSLRPLEHIALSYEGEIYWHHAVYMGTDATGSHYIQDLEPHPQYNNTAGNVTMRKLEVVASRAKEFCIIRWHEYGKAAAEQQGIAARANWALYRRYEYCPVGSNCEHFATWVATGSWDSQQADQVRIAIGRVTVIGGIAGVAAGVFLGPMAGVLAFASQFI